MCPDIIDLLISKFKKSKNIDYLTNAFSQTYPLGLGIELVSYKALKKVYKLSHSKFDKEHVTSFIRRKNIFKSHYYKLKKRKYKNIRLTVDYPEDLIVIKNVIEKFKNNLKFKSKDLFRVIDLNPNLFKANQHIKYE